MTDKPEQAELLPCRCGAERSHTLGELETFSYRYRVGVIDCGECGHAASFVFHFEGEIYEKAHAAWNASLSQSAPVEGDKDKAIAVGQKWKEVDERGGKDG